MSERTLFRWAGGVAIACGLLIAFDKLVPDSFWVSTIGLSAGLLGLFMLTAVWLRQRPSAGALGDAGYILNSAGLALMVGVSFLFNYAFPYLEGASSAAFFQGPGWRVVQVSYAIYVVGVVLFGASIVRAGVFPKAAAALYVLGFGLAWVGFAAQLSQQVDLVGSLIASVAIIWLGADLLRSHLEGDLQPAMT